MPLAAFAEALPIAIGTLMAAAPLVSVPLILVTRPDRRPHHAFVAGWIAGLAAVGAVAIVMSDLSTPRDAAPAPWIVWLRLILGFVLIGFAARKWLGRGKGGKAPAWMSSLDTMSPGTALGLGVALAALNPKNAVLAASGALAIAAATPAPGAQAMAYAGFVLVASLGLITPFVLTLALGARASRPLTALKDRMTRHGDAIIAAVLLILGAIVAWNAFGDL